jgi:hypothetical protein
MAWLQFYIRLLLLSTVLYSHASLAIKAKAVLSESKSYAGFVKLHLHQPTGALYIELKKFNQPFLWQTTVMQGRMNFSKKNSLTKLVQFERRSGYIVLRQLNHGGVYKTSQKFNDDREIIWRGHLLQGKKNIANITDLFLPKKYHRSKSVKKAFVEINSIATYTKNLDISTSLIKEKSRSTTVLKHSFVKPPQKKFKPKLFHPLSGFTGVNILTPHETQTFSTTKTYQQKLALSNTQKINFYLAPDLPKEYLSSVMEAGSWWQKAFIELGMNQALHFKKLPRKINKNDQRYNVIVWHNNLKDKRSQTVKTVDPRTGQIIHASVMLNAHQFLYQTQLARALTSGWKDKEAAQMAVKQFIKDFIRLETAFLIGQALGLDVNLAGSTHQKPSVMDYAAPEFRVEGDEIDISNSLISELSDWEKSSLELGYLAMKPSQRASLFMERLKTHERYVSIDNPFSSHHAYAYASPFDFGQNVFVSLKNINQVRHIAIDNLSKHALEDTQHESELKQLMPMLLMMNLDQIKAVVALIGGVEYETTNNTASPWVWLDPALQETALQTILEHLSITELSLNQQTLKRLAIDTQKTALAAKTIMLPRQFGEMFNTLGLTELYSRQIFHALFQPNRLNRIWQASRADSEQLSLDHYLNQILRKTILNNEPPLSEQSAWMRVNSVLVDTLFKAAEHKLIAPETKAYIYWCLDYIYNYLEPRANRATRERSSHYIQVRQVIKNWLKAPERKKYQYRLIQNPVKLKRLN